MRMEIHWLAGEMAYAPSLETFKVRLNWALSHFV